MALPTNNRLPFWPLVVVTPGHFGVFEKKWESNYHPIMIITIIITRHYWPVERLVGRMVGNNQTHHLGRRRRCCHDHPLANHIPIPKGKPFFGVIYTYRCRRCRRIRFRPTRTRTDWSTDRPTVCMRFTISIASKASTSIHTHTQNTQGWTHKQGFDTSSSIDLPTNRPTRPLCAFGSVKLVFATGRQSKFNWTAETTTTMTMMTGQVIELNIL